MAGTIFFALAPFYQTAWIDAVYDGGLLIVSVAFLADATFRCLDPANRKGNWNVYLGVGSLALLALALLQYGPIATDLRKEREALNSKDADRIASFQQERDEDERNLPNSSTALLLSSIVAEFGVIIVTES